MHANTAYACLSDFDSVAFCAIFVNL